MNTELFNFIGLFVFLTGLCIGSFLNVVSLRAFTGESIVLPPSKCPKCGAKIMPWDNIPVLSYLILGGKCRNCKCHISLQYPVVEFITGAGFLFFYYTFAPLAFDTPFMWKKLLLFPFFAVIFALSVVIAITDIKEKVVFDVHTISLLAIIILFKFTGGMFLDAIIGAVAGAAAMELLSGIGWLFARKRAFGTGDSYIAASIGALLGVKMFVIALVTAVIIQIACIIPFFIKKLISAKEYKLVTLFGVFTVMLILYKLPFITEFNEIFQYVFIILLVIVGFYLCKLLLTLKSLKDNPTYWPFGPSLLLAMFLTALYGGVIKNFYLMLIY